MLLFYSYSVCLFAKYAILFETTSRSDFLWPLFIIDDWGPHPARPILCRTTFVCFSPAYMVLFAIGNTEKLEKDHNPCIFGQRVHHRRSCPPTSDRHTMHMHMFVRQKRRNKKSLTRNIFYRLCVCVGRENRQMDQHTDTSRGRPSVVVEKLVLCGIQMNYLHFPVVNR